MMKTLIASLFVATCAVSTVLAAGDGTAVGVNPDALARTGLVERTLVVGADVSVGDSIVTGPNGRVQLLFADDTRLVVGPRSTLEIESYLLTGSQNDKFAVNALAGTFRFISGTSPKSVYSIDTPTASIAVRGTKFDLTVAGPELRTILYEGAMQICQGAICIDLTDRCEIGAFGSSNGQFAWADGRAEFAGNFPLANIQSAFAPEFRVAGAQACLTPPPAPSLESGMSGNASSDTPPGPIISPPNTCNPNNISGC